MSQATEDFILICEDKGALTFAPTVGPNTISSGLLSISIEVHIPFHPSPFSSTSSCLFQLYSHPPSIRFGIILHPSRHPPLIAPSLHPRQPDPHLALRRPLRAGCCVLGPGLLRPRLRGASRTGRLVGDVDCTPLGTAETTTPSPTEETVWTWFLESCWQMRRSVLKNSIAERGGHPDPSI